jgi:hypothetical protein
MADSLPLNVFVQLITFTEKYKFWAAQIGKRESKNLELRINIEREEKRCAGK